MGAVSSN